MTRWPEPVSPKIVDVDLTSGMSTLEEIAAEDRMRFLGGRGIAARLLARIVTSPIDPLAPEAPLIFSTGTLTGTNAPMTGRSNITFVSPATGMYCKTNVGGQFGLYCRLQGIDQLVIRGAADGPVYLWIDGDRIEIRDATALWGLG
ncbi:MAG: aldehyde ferredoxin oxidoreductase, partial [Candidatus Bipolaricaulota bacterium]